MIIGFSDRWFIKFHLGLDGVGLYGAGYKIKTFMPSFHNGLQCLIMSSMRNRLKEVEAWDILPIIPTQWNWVQMRIGFYHATPPVFIKEFTINIGF